MHPVEIYIESLYLSLVFEELSQGIIVYLRLPSTH